MDALLSVLVEVLFYGIGRVIVAVLTLGFVRGEGFGEELDFPWYRMVKGPDGKTVVSGGVCQLIGLMVLIGVVIGVFVTLHR